ncbi:fibrinogen C domain-containing protein 1-like [Anopheles aquasalis]|uniref:fibrinogen C domain-containing protein 1-like n=1 Tax=Anopheles aquasalis TaxID=42839 RepID=UPI00215A2B29|nr:fibrinogen C domain-containing protein 1-like [Anopheles aquasalis]
MGSTHAGVEGDDHDGGDGVGDTETALLCFFFARLSRNRMYGDGEGAANNWLFWQLADTANNVLQTPPASSDGIKSTDGIMGFGLELLLTKLEHLDHKLSDVQSQINGLPEKMASIRASYETSPTAAPQHKQPPFASCKDAPANASGVFLIRLNKTTSTFKVYCEMKSFGGGWIVIQHRFNGSVDFYRNWADYRDGFGELDSEFWLGLERVHQITAARAHEIVIEMKDFEGNYGYARYNAFQVGSESEQYKLKILEWYSGTAGDGMSRQKGMKFSTIDRDNDGNSDKNWADLNSGAWWHSSGGSSSNLNGPYKNVIARDYKSNWWYNFKKYQGLSFSRMMIREL